MLSSGVGSGIAKHGRMYLFGSRRDRGRRAEFGLPGEQIPLTSVRPGAGVNTSSDNDTDVDGSPLHIANKPETNNFKRTRWSVSFLFHLTHLTWCRYV